MQEPHGYMYTPFEGKLFIGSYLSSRMASIDLSRKENEGVAGTDNVLVTSAMFALDGLISAASHRAGKMFRELSDIGNNKDPEDAVLEQSSVAELAETLEDLSVDKPVDTLELLQALAASELANNHHGTVRAWTNRMVQRFEVTKKLYENYLPGFRKGDGSYMSVRLYWLFALHLCLFYARCGEVKYLSTLLKVCDLLCSLPENQLQGLIPKYGLSTVLASEIVCVNLLAEKNGVSIAPR